jgi:hypothetical protein
MLEAQQPSRTDHAWVRTAMCRFALCACDLSKDFPGYVDQDIAAARLCGPWKKVGLITEARQLAMAACMPQSYRAPPVDAVQRMLDLYGPKDRDHADIQVRQPCDIPAPPPRPQC